MLQVAKRFIEDEQGPTLFEYAIGLGVGFAAAAVLGYLLVPSIRAAVGRASGSLDATAGW